MPQMVSKEFVFVHVDGLEFFGLVILKTVHINFLLCLYDPASRIVSSILYFNFFVV